MQCNIDSKGKLVRVIYGIALVLCGVLLIIFWCWDSGSTLRWLISSLISIGGAFAIFESIKGWCVLRAMGFKTSI